MPIAVVALAATGAAATAQTPSQRARIVSELRTQHLRMRLDGTFKYEFFTPDARAYWNLRGEVMLWQFDSVAGAGRAAAKIAPDGNAIGAFRERWKGLPHWFRRGRVIALYIGDNASTRRALARVLGPQIAGN